MTLFGGGVGDDMAAVKAKEYVWCGFYERCSAGGLEAVANLAAQGDTAITSVVATRADADGELFVLLNVLC